jgi:glycosyltransferase involved in cell wall biosynthesis
MPTPAVTVVIPAYQVSAYIAETIASVFAQTVTDLEAVVVNDGSPDTPALRAALEPYRDRIRYLEQAQGGPSKARNTAIAAARGELLAFLDGDDLWAPQFLASQLARLAADPQAALVWADSQPFGAGPAVPTLMTSEPPVGPCDLAALVTGRCVVFTSTAVARRDAVVEAGGFDERYHRSEDYDLWLRLVLRGRLLYNREVLGRRRLHPASQSASPTAMLQAQIAVRRHFIASHASAVDDDIRRLAEAADRRCEAQIALAEGKRLLAAGDAAAARRALTTAARTFPSVKLAATLRLIAVAPSIAVALQRWRDGAQARRAPDGLTAAAPPR